MLLIHRFPVVASLTTRINKSGRLKIGGMKEKKGSDPTTFIQA